MFICRFRWQLGIHSSSSSCIGTFFSFLALLAFLVFVFEEEQKRLHMLFVITVLSWTIRISASMGDFSHSKMKLKMLNFRMILCSGWRKIVQNLLRHPVSVEEFCFDHQSELRKASQKLSFWWISSTHARVQKSYTWSLNQGRWS